MDKIEWARIKTDWNDPLLEADDELTRGIDREELKLEKLMSVLKQKRQASTCLFEYSYINSYI
jgi:hypothetical protein